MTIHIFVMNWAALTKKYKKFFNIQRYHCHINIRCTNNTKSKLGFRCKVNGNTSYCTFMQLKNILSMLCVSYITKYIITNTRVKNGF